MVSCADFVTWDGCRANLHKGITPRTKKCYLDVCVHRWFSFYVTVLFDQDTQIELRPARPPQIAKMQRLRLWVLCRMSNSKRLKTLLHFSI